MELEKTLVVAAPRQRVWELLLDPKIMAGCVPGTQSVEVLSDVEYLAEIKVKISFIAARFKVKTRIVEARPPEYLRIEGTGEDSSVASSMKQVSELFLTDRGDGTTEIRIKAKADVLGRLGSFGLSVMKTKADRMWDEFGANFSAVATRGLAGEATVAGATPVTAPVQEPTPARSAEAAAHPVPGPIPHHPAQPSETAAAPSLAIAPGLAKWWQRIVGPQPAAPTAGSTPTPPDQRLPGDIYIELHRANSVIKVLWPSSAAAEAANWLKDAQ